MLILYEPFRQLILGLPCSWNEGGLFVGRSKVELSIKVSTNLGYVHYSGF